MYLAFAFLRFRGCYEYEYCIIFIFFLFANNVLVVVACYVQLTRHWVVTEENLFCEQNRFHPKIFHNVRKLWEVPKLDKSTLAVVAIMSLFQISVKTRVGVGVCVSEGERSRTVWKLGYQEMGNYSLFTDVSIFFVQRSSEGACERINLINFYYSV